MRGTSVLFQHFNEHMAFIHLETLTGRKINKMTWLPILVISICILLMTLQRHEHKDRLNKKLVMPKHNYITQSGVTRQANISSTSNWNLVQKQRKYLLKKKCKELGLENEHFKLNNFIIHEESETGYCFLHKGKCN